MNSVNVPFKLLFLVAAHCVLYALVNIFTNKTVAVPLTMGVFASGIVAMLANSITDVINQVYGLELARKTVLCAFATAVMAWAVISVLLAMPAVRETPGFSEVMGVGRWSFAGGLVSHLFSQWYLDTRVFQWLRATAPQVGFWARYNLSNLCSAVTSTAIIATSKFFATGFMEWHAIWGGVLTKICLSVALTPLFVALARHLANEEVTHA